MSTSSKKARVALLTVALVGELIMSSHAIAGWDTFKFWKKKQPNPLPFRPPSYHLSGKKGVSKEEQKALDDEEYNNAKKDDGKLEKLLPDDLVKLCASYLEPATACKVMT